MAHKYILDTHALVWYLEGSPRLGQQAKSAMEADDSDLVLPLIALSEATFLIERGRIQEMNQFVRPGFCLLFGEEDVSLGMENKQ
ncbi:MAG: PIN domain-containing protein [Caldilineaceae bacterium]